MTIKQIDVIIAVYNGARFIEEAIDSVTDQAWPDLSIIVADDGSTDRTNSLVKDLAKSHSDIHLLSLPHKGVSSALNAAIRFSTAPYIAFLDADDKWAKEKLKKQFQALRESTARICFGMMEEFETFGKDISPIYHARLGEMKGYHKSTLLCKREIFDLYGLFDEKIAIGDFVDWYGRIVRSGEPVLMMDEVLAYRRIHDSNTTRAVNKNAFLNILKKHLDKKRKNGGI